MKSTIENKLQLLEKEYGIKILYACESGSRAWGFPSPDSDYDVRFIYCRSLDKYLSISEHSEHLSFPISDELDIYGWDLRKVLRLTYRSNTTPFEWLQSPVIYSEQKGFREELMSICNTYFSRRSNTNHYLGIARGAVETMLEDGSIKIKKLFYVLRPLLAAKWCVERNTIAPMNITPLLTLLPEELRVKLENLIKQKAMAKEGQMIIPDPMLMEWIKETEKQCTNQSKEFGKDYFNPALLDNFFRKTIKQYDHKGT